MDFISDVARLDLKDALKLAIMQKVERLLCG